MMDNSKVTSFTEVYQSHYVTSSYLSETAKTWGQPYVINTDAIRQTVNNVYVDNQPNVNPGNRESAQIIQELEIWEIASTEDLQNFCSILDDLQ